MFATWAWEQAGIPIPRYAFTGDIYELGRRQRRRPAADRHARRGRRRPLRHRARRAPHTSVHVGIVTQVWPDDAIMTVGRRLGPGPRRLPLGRARRSVPPGGLELYNGTPIYAFAQP